MRPALFCLPIVLIAALAVAQTDTTIRASVSVVPVTVSITDKDGRPLRDIQATELTLFDNGHPREIRYFSQDTDVPLTVGLVVDLSGSQMHFYNQHQQQLRQFLTQVLHPGDRSFLVAVGGNPQLATDLTGSLEELLRGVEHPWSGTPFGDPCPKLKFGPGVLAGRICAASPIWNGVYSSARLKLRDVQGRKALVVLSDGMDTGSQHKLVDAIEAAQNADAPVYTIASESVLFSVLFPTSVPRMMLAENSMRRLSNETGGRAYQASGDNSAKIFAEIEQELRDLYVLGFVVPEQDRDGKFHKLEVKSSRAGVRVRSRKGYMATR